MGNEDVEGAKTARPDMVGRKPAGRLHYGPEWPQRGDEAGDGWMPIMVVPGACRVRVTRPRKCESPLGSGYKGGESLLLRYSVARLFPPSSTVGRPSRRWAS